RPVLLLRDPGARARRPRGDAGGERPARAARGEREALRAPLPGAHPREPGERRPGPPEGLHGPARRRDDREAARRLRRGGRVPPPPRRPQPERDPRALDPERHPPGDGPARPARRLLRQRGRSEVAPEARPHLPAAVHALADRDHAPARRRTLLAAGRVRPCHRMPSPGAPGSEIRAAARTDEEVPWLRAFWPAGAMR